MDQRLTYITLGVNDLEKMKTFYVEKFGWTPLKDSDGIVFFKLNGFILGLFPNSELAEDIGIHEMGSGFRKFTFSVNYSSEQEVDAVIANLRTKNVRIVKEPAKVFWGGYSSYVCDIEENYWEIAYNPFLALDEAGNVTGHP